MRLPLWPSAIEPSAVGRNVGCAFCQVLAPVVEYRAVADGQVALERGEGGLVEHLRDQAHVLVHEDLPPVADRDPGGLLAAVLQGVEPEVGQLGDILTGRPDPEDAAGVLRALVMGVECCGQPAVAAGAWPGGEGHVPSLGVGGYAPGIVAVRVFEYLGEIWPRALNIVARREVATIDDPVSQDTLTRSLDQAFTETWSEAVFRDGLQLIAEGVTELVGFGVAVVSVVRNDQLEVVAVAGDDQVRQEIKGTRTPIKTLQEELDKADSWGLMQFVPHERLNDEVLATGWVPDIEPLDVPDAWHPLDLLIAPLYSSAASCWARWRSTSRSTAVGPVPSSAGCWRSTPPRPAAPSSPRWSGSGSPSRCAWPPPPARSCAAPVPS